MMLSLAVVATFGELYSNTRISFTSIDHDSEESSHHSPVHRA
jgi:hypothetical protein